MALLLAVLAPLGCVVWPEGSGPGAPEMTLKEALERQGRGEAVLVDLRSPDAYAAGHIPGALNVSPYEIEKRVGEFRKGPMPVFYCG
jgi:rhodanese-related sulfurtransferase